MYLAEIPFMAKHTLERASGWVQPLSLAVRHCPNITWYDIIHIYTILFSIYLCIYLFTPLSPRHTTQSILLSLPALAPPSIAAEHQALKYVRPHVLELLLRLLVPRPLELIFVQLVRLGYRLPPPLSFLILGLVVDEHRGGDEEGRRKQARSLEPKENDGRRQSCSV